MPAFQRSQVVATCTAHLTLTLSHRKAFVPFFQLRKKGSVPFFQKRKKNKAFCHFCRTANKKALCHFCRKDKNKRLSAICSEQKKEKAFCHFFRTVKRKGFLSFLQNSLFFISIHSKGRSYIFSERPYFSFHFCRIAKSHSHTFLQNS